LKQPGRTWVGGFLSTKEYFWLFYAKQNAEKKDPDMYTVKRISEVKVRNTGTTKIDVVKELVSSKNVDTAYHSFILANDPIVLVHFLRWLREENEAEPEFLTVLRSAMKEWNLSFPRHYDVNYVSPFVDAVGSEYIFRLPESKTNDDRTELLLVSSKTKPTFVGDEVSVEVATKHRTSYGHQKSSPKVHKVELYDDVRRYPEEDSSAWYVFRYGYYKNK
jgi:hypothetical protein